MKQSELFTKARKEFPKDETSLNAQLLIRAGFVDKLAAGIYSFLPLGLRVFKNIEAIIRKEMISLGGEEILMPVLHPKANWETTGRWETYDSLFKFKSFYSKNEYALGPTHEEIITPLIKKFVFSYKDLPKYVFQIQNKFRDEPRAKSGLLRSREFFMKDLYSFHAEEKDLDSYYEKVKKSYQKIFFEVGIGKLTYLVLASGGTFSKYSHEFQTLTPAGEDKIQICKNCHLAINEEIFSEYPSCPSCEKANFEAKKAIEVGNIFKLKDRYSKPFGLVYRDQNGKQKEVLMGCYGIGINRLMGAIVEVYHDENGIIWPDSVAPFRAHLLELDSSAEKIYEKLKKEGIEVLYDDRKISAGEKFAEADLIGIPYRLVVSKKTGLKIEIKKRSEAKSRLLNFSDLIKLLAK